MSQLLRNVIARGFMIQQNLPKTACINRLALSNVSIQAPTPKLSSTFLIKRSYVSNTDRSDNYENAFKFDKDHLGSYKNGHNNFGYKKSYGSPNRYTKSHVINEQDGLDDAEPVESTNKASDYGVTSGFEQYNLPEELLNRMKELGYDKPFEIQEATLKQTLSGRDLIGKAFTGSGKTLAFGIPIITKILNSPNKNSRNPKCLILSPTRELCLQLKNCIQELAPKLTCLAIYGGTDYNSQLQPLRGKVDIICATPGRLRDLIQRRSFVTEDIETICLDEADELLNPNFQEQIKDVIELSNKKQMMMFSATINKNVLSLIRVYMENPAFVDLTKGQKYKLPTNIEHYMVKTHKENCTSLITHFMEKFENSKSIVFVSTKVEAMKYNILLKQQGIRASDLHSNISQNKRAHILDKFRKNKINVLIATDVAARGLDIPDVNLVIQIGFPANGIEYYIHRSGRCGRAGRVGTSVLINNGSKPINPEIYRILKFKRLDEPNTLENDDEERDDQKFFSMRNFQDSPDYLNKRSFNRDSYEGSYNKYNKRNSRQFDDITNSNENAYSNRNFSKKRGYSRQFDDFGNY